MYKREKIGDRGLQNTFDRFLEIGGIYIRFSEDCPWCMCTSMVVHEWTWQIVKSKCVVSVELIRTVQIFPSSHPDLSRDRIFRYLDKLPARCKQFEGWGGQNQMQ